METTQTTTSDITPTTGLTATGTNMRVQDSGVTEFLDDAPVVASVMRSAGTVDSNIPVRDQMLADFFARPYLVSTYTWSTSDAANTQIMGLDLSYLMTAPPWSTKLRGFSLFRGTAVIRVVLNTNPFQQGRLLLSYLPMFDPATDNWRTWTLSQSTQRPNVELDCRDTVAILKIPYMTPYDYHTFLENNSQLWGRVHLNVLGVLKVGAAGETSAQVSVYAYFEDVEFAGPVPYPQSGSSGGPSGKKPKSLRPKSSVSKEKDALASEGVISSALMKASVVADALTNVPFLSSLATPATWLLRGASGTAAWFGWSKPMNDKPPVMVVRRAIPHMANSTGLDTSSQLALIHDNSVSIACGAMSQELDEMSFEYLKRVRAFVTNFTWSDTDGHGTLLYNTVVSPVSFETNVSHVYSTGTLYARSLPPFAYLARHFELWRGTIIIHLKFIKTDFHSGRVEVVFDPTAATITGSLDTTFALREIVDLRTQNEVAFELPYLKAVKYLRTVGSSSSDSGRFYVRVLNSLRRPETVASSVDVLVYASAGDDFELQVPNSSTTLPAMVPQIGEQEEPIRPTEVVIGGYTPSRVDHAISAECIGEHFTSVKQLITRYTQTNDAPVSVAGTLGIYPFSFNLPYTTDTDVGLQFPPLRNDAMSLFGAGYVFFKGGVRLLYAPVGSTQNSAIFSNIPRLIALGSYAVDLSLGVGYGTGDSGTDSGINSILQGNYAYQVFDSSTNVFEVAAPYYCRTHLTKVSVSAFRGALNNLPNYAPRAYIYSYIPGLSETQVALYRSAPDSFCFSNFIGFPFIFSSFTPAP